MIKRINHPDPQNLLFTALLLFSLISHVLVLSQLSWRIHLPDKTETVFEVELVAPEEKTIPPKPEPVPVKPENPVKKAKKTERLLQMEREKAPDPRAGKPEAVPRTSREAARKPRPLKPVPKPMLNITSDLARSVDLQESDVPVGAHKPESPLVSQVNTPLNLVDEPQEIPENRKPAAPRLSFDPKELKRVSSRDVLDMGQIAGTDRESDIMTEISSKRDAVQYRVVEQGGEGVSAGRGSNNSGEHMIEGELRRRRVIFKPEPPLLNLEKDVTITLKFTVLPNGEVDRIFPYRKAAPELEQLAMMLLRQYRFEPLFENDKIQQGIIHFTIYRNR